LPDGLAEALPMLRVLERVGQRRGADPERARRDLDASDLQATHHLCEPESLLAAEQGGHRDAVVIEGQLTAFDALVPQLGQVTRHRKAGTLLDEQDAHPTLRRAGLRVGLAQQRDYP